MTIARAGGRFAVTVLLVAGGLAVAAPGPAVAGAFECRAPRCADVKVPLPADVWVPEPTVRVLLPTGYDDPANASTCYPVLYLLHGAGDHYFTWTENTDVAAFSAGMPVIIVMPDAGHDGDANANPNPAGWYSDWLDGSRQWESFHMDVLRRYVEARYRTRGDGHRAIAGLSMGGFGAMSYAARQAGTFAAAASFSGALDTNYLAPASGAGYQALHDRFGTPDRRVWGDQVADARVWRAHNPTDRAADLRGTELFVASGTGTPGGPAGDDPADPGGYAVEQFIFQQNVSFVRALSVAGVPVHTDFYAGGYHGWPYWQRELHWALPQMLGVTGGATPCAAG